MATRCPLELGLAVLFSAAALVAAEPDRTGAPLADAVQLRDKQAVLSLLNDKVNVNAPQSDGATALHWAAYLEDPETAALLIRAGAKADTLTEIDQVGRGEQADLVAGGAKHSMQQRRG